MFRFIRKRKKYLFAVVMVASLAFLIHVKARAGEYNGLTYTIENQTVTITGYSGSSASLTLPSQLEGCPITAINEGSFSKNSTLEIVDLSETDIVAVPDSCFQSALYLKTVILPATVEEIGVSAFQDCTSLEEIEIPVYCETIGAYAFYGCSKLTTVSNHSVKLSMMDKFSFFNCPELRTLYIPAVCTVSSNIIDVQNATNLISAESNSSFQQSFSEYENITYYSDFEVTADTDSGDEAKKLSFTLEDWSSYQICWVYGGTVVAENCITISPDQNGEYVCYISNGIFVHEIQYNVSSADEEETADPASTDSPSGNNVTIKKVTGIKISEKTDRLYLTWKSTANATGYYIYRSGKKNGKYTKIASVKKNKYKSQKLTRGKKYYFRIIAYRKKQGNIFQGTFSKIVSKKLQGTPSTPALSQKGNYICWKRTKGTDGVVIYARVHGIWGKVKTLSFTAYHNNGIAVTSSKIEAVKIKSYRIVKYKGKQYRAYSKLSNSCLF
ncbi:MAG: fibronectin type III domain-containing protein [Clostridiaceae bacterium]|nr:fibronectin type III domain-containing protein [Clostridiaceae bacterium]